MKKVLIAFDGTHYAQGAVACAKWLNRLQPITLTGAFLPLTDYANLWSYAGTATGQGKTFPMLEKAADDDVRHNIERFKTVCAGNQINYTVHHDFTNFALPELKKETRYADLLVIGAGFLLADAEPGSGELFLNDALHQSECPVMLAPAEFHPPTENIIAYDGSASSVYALKQFATLFPSLCGNETLVVYAGSRDAEQLPDDKNIRELIAAYFPKVTTLAMDIDPHKYFSAWLKEHSNALLVTGAFGRSGFSRLFRESFLAAVLRERSVPIFVAHR